MEYDIKGTPITQSRVAGPDVTSPAALNGAAALSTTHSAVNPSTEVVIPGRDQPEDAERRLSAEELEELFSDLVEPDKESDESIALAGQDVPVELLPPLIEDEEDETPEVHVPSGVPHADVEEDVPAAPNAASFPTPAVKEEILASSKPLERPVDDGVKELVSGLHDTKPSGVDAFWEARRQKRQRPPGSKEADKPAGNLLGYALSFILWFVGWLARATFTAVRYAWGQLTPHGQGGVIVVLIACLYLASGDVECGRRSLVCRMTGYHCPDPLCLYTESTKFLHKGIEWFDRPFTMPSLGIWDWASRDKAPLLGTWEWLKTTTAGRWLGFRPTKLGLVDLIIDRTATIMWWTFGVSLGMFGTAAYYIGLFCETFALINPWYYPETGSLMGIIMSAPLFILGELFKLGAVGALCKAGNFGYTGVPNLVRWAYIRSARMQRLMNDLDDGMQDLFDKYDKWLPGLPWWLFRLLFWAAFEELGKRLPFFGLRWVFLALLLTLEHKNPLLLAVLHVHWMFIGILPAFASHVLWNLFIGPRIVLSESPGDQYVVTEPCRRTHALAMMAVPTKKKMPTVDTTAYTGTVPTPLQKLVSDVHVNLKLMLGAADACKKKPSLALISEWADNANDVVALCGNALNICTQSDVDLRKWLTARHTVADEHFVRAASALSTAKAKIAAAKAKGGAAAVPPVAAPPVAPPKVSVAPSPSPPTPPPATASPKIPVPPVLPIPKGSAPASATAGAGATLATRMSTARQNLRSGNLAGMFTHRGRASMWTDLGCFVGAVSGLIRGMVVKPPSTTTAGVRAAPVIPSEYGPTIPLSKITTEGMEIDPETAQLLATVEFSVDERGRQPSGWRYYPYAAKFAGMILCFVGLFYFVAGFLGSLATGGFFQAAVAGVFTLAVGGYGLALESFASGHTWCMKYLEGQKFVTVRVTRLHPPNTADKRCDAASVLPHKRPEWMADIDFITHDFTRWIPAVYTVSRSVNLEHFRHIYGNKRVMDYTLSFDTFEERFRVAAQGAGGVGNDTYNILDGRFEALLYLGILLYRRDRSRSPRMGRELGDQWFCLFPDTNIKQSVVVAKADMAYHFGCMVGDPGINPKVVSLDPKAKYTTPPHNSRPRGVVATSQWFRVNGVSYIHYDIGDQHSLCTGIQARVLSDRPVYSMERMLRASFYTRKFCEQHFEPLPYDVDLTLELWLSESSYTDKQKDALRRAFAITCDILDPELRAIKVLAFMKMEGYPEVKPPRGIYPRSDQWKVYIGPLVKQIEHVVYKHKSAVKNIPVHERIHYIDQMFKGLHKIHTTDYKKYESLHRIYHMFCITFILLEYMAGHLPEAKVVLNKMRRVIAGMQRMDMASFKAAAWFLLMSGEMVTSLFNWFLNLVAHNIAFDHCNDIYVPLEELIPTNTLIGVFEGDDGLIAAPAGKRLPTADEMRNIWGMVVTRTKDRGPATTRSFCGIIADPYEKINVTDPRKIIMNFPRCEGQWAFTTAKKRQMLLLAKACSYYYQYNGCPIVTSYSMMVIRSLAKYQLSWVRKMVATSTRIDSYKRKAMLAVLDSQLPTRVDPGMHTRVLVEERYNLPYQVQVSMEEAFDGVTSESSFDCPVFLDCCDQVHREHFDTYVSLVNYPKLELPSWQDRDASVMQASATNMLDIQVRANGTYSVRRDRAYACIADANCQHNCLNEWVHNSPPRALQRAQASVAAGDKLIQQLRTSMVTSLKLLVNVLHDRYGISVNAQVVPYVAYAVADASLFTRGEYTMGRGRHGQLAMYGDAIITQVLHETSLGSGRTPSEMSAERTFVTNNASLAAYYDANFTGCSVSWETLQGHPPGERTKSQFVEALVGACFWANRQLHVFHNSHAVANHICTFGRARMYATACMACNATVAGGVSGPGLMGQNVGDQCTGQFMCSQTCALSVMGVFGASILGLSCITAVLVMARACVRFLASYVGWQTRWNDHVRLFICVCTTANVFFVDRHLAISLMSYTLMAALTPLVQMWRVRSAARQAPPPECPNCLAHGRRVRMTAVMCIVLGHAANSGERDCAPGAFCRGSCIQSRCYGNLVLATHGRASHAHTMSNKEKSKKQAKRTAKADKKIVKEVVKAERRALVKRPKTPRVVVVEKPRVSAKPRKISNLRQAVRNFTLHQQMIALGFMLPGKFAPRLPVLRGMSTAAVPLSYTSDMPGNQSGLVVMSTSNDLDISEMRALLFKDSALRASILWFGETAAIPLYRSQFNDAGSYTTNRQVTFVAGGEVELDCLRYKSVSGDKVHGDYVYNARGKNGKLYFPMSGSKDKAAANSLFIFKLAANVPANTEMIIRLRHSDNGETENVVYEGTIAAGVATITAQPQVGQRKSGYYRATALFKPTTGAANPAPFVVSWEADLSVTSVVGQGCWGIQTLPQVESRFPLIDAYCINGAAMTLTEAASVTNANGRVLQFQSPPNQSVFFNANKSLAKLAQVNPELLEARSLYKGCSGYIKPGSLEDFDFEEDWDTDDNDLVTTAEYDLMPSEPYIEFALYVPSNAGQVFSITREYACEWTTTDMYQKLSGKRAGKNSDLTKIVEDIGPMPQFFDNPDHKAAISGILHLGGSLAQLVAPAAGQYGPAIQMGGMIASTLGEMLA